MKLFTRELNPTEVRAPLVATRKVSGLGLGQALRPSVSEENAIRWGYLANVIVYRCTQLIANDLAKLPFRAGADPDKPKDFNPNAPLARLLGPPPDGPAPNISARALWRHSIAQRVVLGRFAWEIERDRNGIPIAFYPLITRLLHPVPSDGGTEMWKEFKYRTDNRERSLRTNQVFYDWQPSLNDWRQADSDLQAASLDISVAVMQDRYDFAFLRNDARPASMVVSEAWESADHRERFRQQFQGEYGGPDNAGKVAFAEVEGETGDAGVTGLIDVKALGLSQRDAEFIKRHEQKFRNIAIALGVPFSKLDASGRTFANAEAEDKTYWQDRIEPLAQEVADAVNMQLAPDLGSEVGWFDFTKVTVLQGKKNVAVVGAPSLVQAQIATINEAREAVGFASMAGLDRFMTAEEIAAIKMPEKAERAKPEPPKPKLLPERSTRSKETVEERRLRVWRSNEQQIVAFEKMWTRALKKIFRRQRDSTIARLQGKRGRQFLTKAQAKEFRQLNPQGIFDPAFWESETGEFVRALYESVALVSGTRILERLGFSFDIEAAFVKEFIHNRANQLAGQVTNTTYRAIQKQLALGVAGGEDIDALAKRIRGVFTEADKVRATRIARTEVVSAFNASAQKTIESVPSDLVGAKEWIATMDGRVRPTHASTDGQVVEVSGKFQVGGSSMSYPGDPAGAAKEVVSCRCSIAYLTPEEAKEALG